MTDFALIKQDVIIKIHTYVYVCIIDVYLQEEMK